MNSNIFDSRNRPFNVNKSAVSEKIRKLINFLELRPNERSNYQTHQISLYLEEFPFFSRFASSGLLTELIKHLKIENFQLGSIIIPHTATASNFYLILTGRVAQYNKNDKGYDQGREFTSGSTFGDRGMLNELFKEEYRTLESSQVMVLEKATFEEVLSNNQKEKYQEQYSFFSSLPILERLSNETISHLASIALPKKFAPHSILAKQNDKPRGFYIVQSGSAKLLRNVDIEHCGQVYSRIIEIEEVESGGMICDYAFIHSEPLKYSVLCSMPLIAFFMDKDDFRGPNLRYLNEIKGISNQIPSDEQLSQKFIQKVSWKKFKDRFMKSLDIRKKGKNFERTPKIEKIKLPKLNKLRNISV